MSTSEIREPIQKRSIEKKEKIILAGFELICDKGYYNTNTAEIAKHAGVSTGIVYQYFKDKHDILIAGIKEYANSIFYPMLSFSESKPDINNIDTFLRNMITEFIDNHKLSQTAHQEIMAMVHSDSEVAHLFHNSEINITNKFTDFLISCGFNSKNLKEKVHISMHLIDDLCHEIIYHKHKEMNYDVMIDLVIKTIKTILT